MDRTANTYVVEMSSAFDRAADVLPVVTHCVQIAGAAFELHFAGSALPPAILPALVHLPVGADAGPVVRLYLWDTASTGVEPPSPPFAQEDYTRYGQRAFAHDGGMSWMCAPLDRVICAYDRETMRGYFWTADAGSLSIYERAAPLQTLFHWSLAEFGWHIIHAAALGTEAGGVLLVGNSGAGKSTTALACLQSTQLQYLSDDKCLVTLDPTPRALGLFNSAKLKADMLDHLADLKPVIADWDEKLKGGKYLLHLFPGLRQKMVAEFPIRAILVAQIAHAQQAALTRITPNQVLHVLGPSTVIWLTGGEHSSLHFIARLAKSLPCYRLHLAQNPADNLDLIVETLRENS